ncbi:MAG TPA: DUF2516 family protein [Acidimicrobiales bacterium]|nr:DUF2516 family protein [Acidimicrobiales bacterium]
MGFVEGPVILIVLVILVMGLVLPLWALIDAASRPDWAWQQIGSAKSTYIILIVVGFFLFGIVGLIASIVYLAAARPRLVEVMARAGGDPGFGPGAYGVPPPQRPTPAAPVSVAPPPGWYTDPRDPSRQRWWDGSAWTEHQQ